MIVTNNKMKQHMLQESSARQSLHPAFADLLSKGWICAEDSYFLAHFHEIRKDTGRQHFPDATGHECFINALHVDDYVEGDFFAQAMALAEALIVLWEAQGFGLPLKVIVGETDFGFHVRAHVERPGEVWIDENELENFEEAILIMRNRRA